MGGCLHDFYTLGGTNQGYPLSGQDRGLFVFFFAKEDTDRNPDIYQGPHIAPFVSELYYPANKSVVS